MMFLKNNRFMMRIHLLLILSTLSLFSQAITSHLEYQKISSVGYGWSHISFANSYIDPIMVCSNVLADSTKNEAVVRINNLSGSGADIKIQQPNDVDPGYATDVYCIISDEGSYSIPFKYEAHKVLSTGTSGQNVLNTWTAVNTENVTASVTQTYTRPAVLGQVMSYNDAAFSTFWSFDCDSRQNRPFQSGMADGICVGKHIGMIDAQRANETLGYIVAEAGIYELEDFSMAVNYGSDSVKGVGDNPAYSYALDKSYTHGVVTQEAMDGVNGSWAVPYGVMPFSSSVNLAVDEETVAGDTTRTHTKEEVAYWVFLNDPIDLAEMKINELMYKETSGNVDEFIELYVTKSGNLKNYLFTDQDGSSHHYRFPKHTVAQGDYVVLHIGIGTDSVNGKVHHFYMGRSSVILNNTGDDIVFLKPSNNDLTVVDGVGISGTPFDYMTYDVGADSIPISQKGVTVNWNSSESNRLADTIGGTSISLTPNAIDSDTSLCWEITATTDSAKKATNCTNYIGTYDSNTQAGMVNSIGETNTRVPDIKLSKTSVTIYDPINLQNNPKAIPGAVVKYGITGRNEGFGSTDNNSIAITDKVPTKMKICVSTVGQCKEVSFVEGTPASTLALGTITYSNNNGVDFTYTPTADAEGFDTSVTDIRIQLTGSFKESDGTNHPNFTLELIMGVI
jgi:hypothetical protein